LLSVCVLCGSPVWPFPPVVGPLWGPPLCVGPLCGSPVRVPCMGPLCGSPLCGSPVWVPSVWVPRRAAFHVASTRVMSPARSHAPAQLLPFAVCVYACMQLHTSRLDVCAHCATRDDSQ